MSSHTAAPGSVPILPLALAITVLGTMAMHLFVPAMPSMARDLHASPAAIQQTVTLYVLGLAVGPSVYGPLSDRLGRRPLLMAGLSLYLAATVAAAFVTNVEQLLAARLVQALGASAGLALGRAIVRDISQTDAKAAGGMAILSTVVAIVPAISAPVGGQLDLWLGWRALFGIVAAMLAAVILYSLLRLPETLPKANPGAGVLVVLRSYPQLLRIRRFLAYAIGGCCSYGFYAYFAASPFILVGVLQRPQGEVGLCYLVACLAIAAGSLSSSRLVRRLSPPTVARIGNLLHIAGGALLLAAAATDSLSLVTFMLPSMLVAFGSGMAAPNASALAIGAAPRLVGATSALYSTLLMVVAGVATAAVSLAPDSAMPTAVVFLVSGLLGSAFFAMGARKQGAPKVHADG